MISPTPALMIPIKIGMAEPVRLAASDHTISDDLLRSSFKKVQSNTLLRPPLYVPAQPWHGDVRSSCHDNCRFIVRIIPDNDGHDDRPCRFGTPFPPVSGYAAPCPRPCKLRQIGGMSQSTQLQRQSSYLSLAFPPIQ